MRDVNYKMEGETERMRVNLKEKEPKLDFIFFIY